MDVPNVAVLAASDERDGHIYQLASLYVHLSRQLSHFYPILHALVGRSVRSRPVTAQRGT